MLKFKIKTQYALSFCLIFSVFPQIVAAFEDTDDEFAEIAQRPAEQHLPKTISDTPLYRIGPGDGLNVFVWRNADLTQAVPVRPDGRISLPLVEDLMVAGKTPTEVARKIEKVLSKYVKDPIVTVIVTNFIGSYDQQVRVVGEAANPQALPYRSKMTLLDVMIAVGGLTVTAAGNRSTVIREKDGIQKQFKVKVEDLVKDGDISQNVDMLPGDILIIPESWF